MIFESIVLLKDKMLAFVSSNNHTADTPTVTEPEQTDD